jgi:hypothetical protein
MARKKKLMSWERFPFFISYFPFYVDEKMRKKNWKFMKRKIIFILFDSQIRKIKKINK